MTRWITSPALPPTIPAVAYEAVAREGEGARLFEVVGVDWPDSCLGGTQRGLICLAMITPGYRVLVEKRGWLIEYHTGLEDGAMRWGFAGRVEDRPAATNR
jgi:hypothetical protein